MADYATATVDVQFSELVDHSDPQWATNWDAYRLTPTSGHSGKATLTTGGATTITIVAANALFSTIALFAIQNMDPPGGNKVTVAWTDNDAHANTQKIPPGGIMVVADIDGTVAITGGATDAPVEVRYTVAGERK